MVPLSDLIKHRHPSNNNNHPAGQIKAYIKILRAGIRQPIVVSRQSGLILKGHGALESALKAGWTHYPVQYQDFPDGEAQELAFLLADNQLASLAKTDKTVTAGILEKLRENKGFDISLTGFSKPKIDSLLAKMRGRGSDGAPVIGGVSEENSGDPTDGGLVMGEGRVRLFLGECWNIMPGLPGINAVISDPPFSDRTHSKHDARVNSEEEEGTWDGADRKALGYASWGRDEVRRVCRDLPSTGWVCIITDHVLSREWEPAMVEAGRCVFAPVPVIVRGRNVRLSGDGPSSWTDWMVVGRTTHEAKWGTLPGVYEGTRGTIKHMGGKPVDAMCRIVEDYSRPGDTVLDFCMGAGTTGIACLMTGRRFVGIERDPIHFEKARRRIEEELSKLAAA